MNKGWVKRRKAMWIIFSYTLRKLMRTRNTIIYMCSILIVVVGVSAASKGSLGDSGQSTLMAQKSIATGIFSMLCFLWIAGIPMIISIVSNGMGLIANEETEGTLLILVSKPITRMEIIFGKFLALIVSRLLLFVATLFSGLAIMNSLTGMDPEVFDTVFQTLPGMLAYGGLVVLIFSSFSILFSTVFKKKIVGTIIMLLMVMLIYALIPYLRMTLLQSGIYETFKMYIFDLNYQLGNILYHLLHTAEGVRLTPLIQILMSMFIGIYSPMQSTMDADIQAMPPTLELSNYLSPWVSIALWLTISTGAVVLSFLKLYRKDVI